MSLELNLRLNQVCLNQQSLWMMTMMTMTTTTTRKMKKPQSKLQRLLEVAM